MTKIIGVPSNGPGLSDSISGHFGHCEYFLGFKIIEDNKIESEFTIKNNGHTGCMEPVIKLKQNNVTDVIIGGIGGRPFQGFLQLGINLYRGVEGSVNKNIELLLQDKLEPLGGPSCGGSSGGCNHEH